MTGLEIIAAAAVSAWLGLNSLIVFNIKRDVHHMRKLQDVVEDGFRIEVDKVRQTVSGHKLHAAETFMTRHETMEMQRHILDELKAIRRTLDERTVRPIR